MNNQWVVGIGGSAGSLLALPKIFDHTPLDDAAYIILRHLPIGYQSELKTILRRHSEMKVEEAKDDAPIENGTIYYAPPNHHVIIKGSRLKLVKRNRTQPNRALDIFFNSLAENNSIGNSIIVILSGMGSDGIQGAQHFKSKKGIVIVQSPETCEFPDLPRQIIKNNNADYVLAPQQIPAVIREISKSDIKAKYFSDPLD